MKPCESVGNRVSAHRYATSHPTADQESLWCHLRTEAGRAAPAPSQRENSVVSKEYRDDR